MQLWNNFAAKHPAAAKWVREGGLFVIVSNLVTVFKYLLLQFLPAAFSSLPVVDFGWPGIPVTLFGETFQWNILGYDSAHGGLPYFCAYMVAMVVGECINFPIQRNFVFRSKGNLAKQIACGQTRLPLRLKLCPARLPAWRSRITRSPLPCCAVPAGMLPF